jgi:putative phage-type endonuclease
MNDQNTAAWFSARTGKLTASRMADAMSFKKDGKPSEARTKYMMEVVAERLTDTVARHFVTDAMQWGKDQEQHAKDAYFQMTGNAVKPCFFFDHFDIDNFGASPDGLVDQDGLLETKCPTSSTHIKWVMSGVVPDEHKPQMIAQALCTGRKWIDFVSYDPRIASAKRILILRYTPTQEELETVEQAARKFLAEADAMFDFMTQQAA